MEFKKAVLPKLDNVFRVNEVVEMLCSKGHNCCRCAQHLYPNG